MAHKPEVAGLNPTGHFSLDVGTQYIFEIDQKLTWASKISLQLRKSTFIIKLGQGRSGCIGSASGLIVMRADTFKRAWVRIQYDLEQFEAE